MPPGIQNAEHIERKREEALLLFPGLFDRGDIAQNDGEEFLAADLDLGNGCLNVDLAPTGMQPGNGSQASHAARSDTRFGKGVDVVAMGSAEAFGQKAVYGLSQHFGAGVAKDQFGGRIEKDDTMVAIDGDDGIHR